MRVLLDTSVLVAALVEAHARHAQAFPWLQKTREADFQGLIATHSIAETYAVLTSLPLSPRIAPSAARWRMSGPRAITPSSWRPASVRSAWLACWTTSARFERAQRPA